MPEAGRRAEHLGQTPWMCDPNAIICMHDHLWAHYKADYRGDFKRLSGHAFLECRLCAPPTQFLAVFAKIDGIASTTCYALDKPSFDFWNTSPDPTPSTPELLYLVRDPHGRSHNPYWRPKPRQTR